MVSGRWDSGMKLADLEWNHRTDGSSGRRFGMSGIEGAER